MSVKFNQDVCTNLAQSEAKEWLVTNGIGGFGSGTISGLLTRRYHGLLIAALQPPLGRTLMLSKLNETATYNNLNYDLYSDRWADGTIFPHGYELISKFFLVGTTPVWQYKLIDALLEKRIWMGQGENTTYIRYIYKHGDSPITLSLDALVNYRDYHGDSHSNSWEMQIDQIETGLKIKAKADASNLYLLAKPTGNLQSPWQTKHIWHHNFSLAVEKYRGLIHCEDHLLAGNYTVTLKPGESVTIVSSTKSDPILDGQTAWQKLYHHEQELLSKAGNIKAQEINARKSTPQWINTLVLAANQLIVDRSTTAFPNGKTIIAGYPWFSDWGRDTMISLPGLTLSIGRPSVARFILRTFAAYVSQGMLPNVFPDSGSRPDYNTVDATLWYFEAAYAYYQHTKDKSLINELFPILNNIIDSYRQGTRYNIHQDTDGLIYAGGKGLQLTWMDAKADDWVVTPRTGKPIEINALWYNSLIIMKKFAQILGQSDQKFALMANMVEIGFKRFWNEKSGYCYDVIDGPDGDDDSLRPNQIFAVSLPSAKGELSLLTANQRQSIVDTVAQKLLTPYGLRSLASEHPDYQGLYGGNSLNRNGAYHQGTVWTWLIGHFVQAHLKIYQNPDEAMCILLPFKEHLKHGCVGSISEIFDGDSPFFARGCFSQAWSVAEVLRSWELIKNY